ncbi:MAG: CobW family GTP-binding protein [Spirochaetia bacterium]
MDKGDHVMEKKDSAIRTVLLTGFLGAGKTTLLNRLINYYAKRADRLAVLVNEFGSAGIDGTLVQKGDYYTAELNRGSIFCVCIRTDFIFEIKKIAREIKPQILLIEATGIARLDDMYSMMKQGDLDGLMDLEQNICVVDAGSFHKVFATSETVRQQAEFADLFILNKTDTVDRERLEETEALLRDHNPNAPIIRTVYGEWEGDNEIPLAPVHNAYHDLGEPSQRELFFSTSFQEEGTADPDRWHSLIDRIKPDILRAKGYITLPSGLHFFEIVNNEYAERKAEPEGGTPEKASGFNRFVFIGREKDPVDRDSITACFSS